MTRSLPRSDLSSVVVAQKYCRQLTQRLFVTVIDCGSPTPIFELPSEVVSGWRISSHRKSHLNAECGERSTCFYQIELNDNVLSRHILHVFILFSLLIYRLPFLLFFDNFYIHSHFSNLHIYNNKGAYSTIKTLCTSMILSYFFFKSHLNVERLLIIK